MALPAEHEEMDGGSTFLYLILADGSAHEVGNMGNTYLVIDGDYFEADYSWLSSWDSIIPEGEGPLPEENPVRQLTLDEVLELSEKGGGPCLYEFILTTKSFSNIIV